MLKELAQAYKENTPADQIRGLLEKRGVGVPITYDWMPGSAGEVFVVADLDGNGTEEWIISLFFRPGSCFFGRDGNENGELWIIGEHGLQYRLHPTAEDDFFWGAPVVIAAADMTGDSLPEITTRSIGCGAHTAMGAYHILGFRDGMVQSVVEPGSTLEAAANFVRAYSNPYLYDWSAREIAIPTPSDQVADVTSDGLPDLVLGGGTYGSAGAGYVRQRTEAWGWNGDDVLLVSIEWAESTERFHLLYDANFAYALSDFAQAEILYERVIKDETLDNNVGFGPNEENLAAAQQFAAFRLVLLSLMTDDRSSALDWSQWLNSHFSGTPLTQAAELLIANGDSLRLQESCDQITAFLQQRGASFPVTGTLIDAGYGNPSIGAADVCRLP